MDEHPAHPEDAHPDDPHPGDDIIDLTGLPDPWRAPGTVIELVNTDGHFVCTATVLDWFGTNRPANVPLRAVPVVRHDTWRVHYQLPRYCRDLTPAS